MLFFIDGAFGCVFFGGAAIFIPFMGFLVASQIDWCNKALAMAFCVTAGMLSSAGVIYFCFVGTAFNPANSGAYTTLAIAALSWIILLLVIVWLRKENPNHIFF